MNLRTSRAGTRTVKLGWLALLCAGLFAPATVFAEVDALVLQAKDLSDKGQAQAAFTLMEPHETRRAGDADFDLMFGVVANQIGDHNRAILALERAIVVQPGNARARAELARALFAVGDRAGARRLLAEVKEQGVPVEVATTLDQFMRAIDRVEEAGRSSFKGYVEAGIGNDSNVNGGPSFTTVAVPSFGGAVVTLAPAGVKTQASFTTLGAGLSGRYVIDPRWSAIGSASVNWRWNADPSQGFNSMRGDLSGGFSYREERNEFSVVAQVGAYDIGGNNARNSTGLVGEWTHRFDGFRQAGAYLQTGRLAYPGQPIRDAQRNVLGVSYAQLFKTGLLAFGGLYGGNETPNSGAVPHLGHQLSGLRGGVQQPFSDRLAAFGTLGFEQRSFGGVDPNFLVTRSDQQSNLNVGLTWTPWQAWRITPQIAWTQVKSNVPINEFDQTVFSVTARREF
jgi:outer membrane protein